MIKQKPLPGWSPAQLLFDTKGAAIEHARQGKLAGAWREEGRAEGRTGVRTIIRP